MKKVLLILSIFILSTVSFSYDIGDVVSNVTINGQIPGGAPVSTTIHEQIDQGNAVMIFLGDID